MQLLLYHIPICFSPIKKKFTSSEVEMRQLVLDFAQADLGLKLNK